MVKMNEKLETQGDLSIIVISEDKDATQFYLEALEQRGYNPFPLTPEIIAGLREGREPSARNLLDNVAVVFVDPKNKKYRDLEGSVRGLVSEHRTNPLTPEFLRTSYYIGGDLPDDEIKKPVKLGEFYSKIEKAIQRYRAKLQTQS